MHQLKEEMIMNLDLKGFSPATKKTYLQHMKNYTRYFKKSPEMMGEAVPSLFDFRKKSWELIC